MLLHHSSFLFATSAGFRLCSEVLLNAHAVVIRFFVLSGVVVVAYTFFIHFRIPTFGYSHWYAPQISSVPTTSQIISNFASIGSTPIPPTWSVRVEIIGSALIP